MIDRYSPLMVLVDKLLGPLDELIASRLIADWRDEVWRQAVRYLEMTSSDERDELRREVEAATLHKAGFILLR